MGHERRIEPSAGAESCQSSRPYARAGPSLSEAKRSESSARKPARTRGRSRRTPWRLCL